MRAVDEGGGHGYIVGPAQEVVSVDAIRYGIIGSGMMGVEHIRNIVALPGGVVAGLADPHPPSLDAAIAAAGAVVPTFPDHRDLIDADLCDAYVIATPNHLHVQAVLDVMATGKHLLVEKPLATTIEDCRKLVVAGDGYPGVVWVGLEYRFMPAVARVIAEVRAGTVGPVMTVGIREHRYPFLQKVGDWNRFNRNSGGTLVEKCCHFFDLMNVIVGERPVSVYATGSQALNHLDEVYDGEVPDVLDNAYVLVEYASGAKAMLDLCMFAEASRYQEEIAVVGPLGKVEALVPTPLPIAGSGPNTVRIGLRRDGRVEAFEAVDPRIAFSGDHHGSSYLQHLAFVEAIRVGRRAAVTLEDGLMSVAMGVAGHRSIEERRPVLIEEVLG